MLYKEEVKAAPRRIVVLGEGEATAMPDLAIITLGVVREAPTAREALDANNKAMAEVISAIKTFGVADRDLKTARLEIRPRYDYPKKRDGTQKTKLVAYQVRNSLTVRVRDLSKVGQLLDNSVALGVNEGGGLAFVNDNVSAIMTEARRKAVSDAMDKAKTLSDAAQVKLGPIIDISEGLGRSSMRSDYGAACEAPGVSIQGGENTFRVQVNVTFELN